MVASASRIAAPVKKQAKDWDAGGAVGLADHRNLGKRTSTMTDQNGLEAKAERSALAHEFEDFMRAFEAFKETNDERLAKLNNALELIPVTTEKLARIDRALDETKRDDRSGRVKAQRPQLGGGGQTTAAGLAHKAAFDGYVRKGECANLRELEPNLCLSALTPTAAIWCPTKRSVRSTPPCGIFRRSARLPVCGRSPVLSTRCRSQPAVRRQAGSGRRLPVLKPTRRADRAFLSDHGTLCDAGGHTEPA